MSFGTVINCIDGRVQIPVLNYLQANFEPEYFDACNEAGPLKIITKHKGSCRLLALKDQLKVSLNKHGSKLLAVVGHHDCSGNPVSREEKEGQIVEALDYLRRAYGKDKLYVGLYVDERWEVNEIHRIEAEEVDP